MQPEVASVHIQAFQGLILVYLASVATLFIFQAIRQPKISDSVTKLRCEKLKYWLIWAPFMLFIVAIEMLTIVVAFMVNIYWYTWADLL